MNQKKSPRATHDLKRGDFCLYQKAGTNFMKEVGCLRSARGGTRKWMDSVSLCILAAERGAGQGQMLTCDKWLSKMKAPVALVNLVASLTPAPIWRASAPLLQADCLVPPHLAPTPCPFCVSLLLSSLPLQNHLVPFLLDHFPITDAR